LSGFRKLHFARPVPGTTLKPLADPYLPGAPFSSPVSRPYLAITALGLNNTLELPVFLVALFIIALILLIVLLVRAYSPRAPKNGERPAWTAQFGPDVLAKLPNREMPPRWKPERRAMVLLKVGAENRGELLSGEDPGRVVETIRAFQQDMGGLILDRNGALLHQQDFALSAAFGIPYPSEGREVAACRAALDVLEAGNEKGRAVRVCLVSGEGICGNLNGVRNAPYGVAGRIVSRAEHLHSLNGFYGTPLLVDAATYGKINGQALARPVDKIVFPGEKEPENLYQILGLNADSVPVSTRELVQHFQNGHQHYLERNWDWAMNLFRQALQIDRNDHLSRLYILRCQNFMKNPPGPLWEGVYAP
ncbi:MAG TPA: hypothetical protein PKV71_15850, partial [Calditrichia bacterium]|nr:hypothetical protein [Calditrichia bacterium]